MFTTTIEQARGYRPTVVLLHSSASSARQWDALVRMLEPAFRVRALDFHGHGAHPAWPGERPLTLPDDAALAVPLLREAGGAHLVGHSYGGAVALKLAAMHPRLVHSVVAYEPVLFSWLNDDGPWDPTRREVAAWGEAMGARLAQGDEAGAARLFVDFWSGAGAYAGLPPARQLSIAGRMRAVYRHFFALTTEPLRSREIARLDAPKLILSGAATVPATRRIADLLRRGLRRDEHQVLDGMGHMGPITHAETVNLRIAWFLLARAGAGVAPEPLRAAA